MAVHESRCAVPFAMVAISDSLVSQSLPAAALPVRNAFKMPFTYTNAASSFHIARVNLT